MPGLAALNQGGAALVHSVPCASAGHGSAGGFYYDTNFDVQAFIVNKT